MKWLEFITLTKENSHLAAMFESLIDRIVDYWPLWTFVLVAAATVVWLVLEAHKDFKKNMSPQRNQTGRTLGFGSEPQAHLLILDGQRAEQAGDISGALRLYEAAIEIAPTNSKAWHSKALIHHAKNEFTEALWSYDQSLQYADEPSTWFDRAILFINHYELIGEAVVNDDPDTRVHYNEAIRSLQNAIRHGHAQASGVLQVLTIIWDEAVSNPQQE